jgi:hypothetical protein
MHSQPRHIIWAIQSTVRHAFSTPTPILLGICLTKENTRRLASSKFSALAWRSAPLEARSIEPFRPLPKLLLGVRRFHNHQIVLGPQNPPLELDCPVRDIVLTKGGIELLLEDVSILCERPDRSLPTSEVLREVEAIVRLDGG